MIEPVFIIKYQPELIRTEHVHDNRNGENVPCPLLFKLEIT